MKKRILALLLASLLLSVLALTGCGSSSSSSAAPAGESTPPAASEGGSEAPAADGDTVTLTMGSWRADDVAQMEALFAKYNELVPNVEIQFQPINPPDYNATLRMQLEGGTGPDLLYARSYATSLELYDAGFLADCSDVAGLAENFSDANRAPWTTPDGTAYAVPFIAVSHAVYYNKDLFAAEGIEVPTTYEEFLEVCQKLKDAGHTPLANGIADEWDVLEVFFLNMLPNYVGGSAEREKYESGEKALNDEAFVAAYTDFAKVAPFLPTGFEAVTYNDSQSLFETQQAAMFADGSWTIGVYDEAPFEWGVFSIPAPAGSDTRVTFQPDVGLSINAATQHPEEAKAFLEWLCTPEGVEIALNLVPKGFFPLIDAPITLQDAHSNEFLQLNEGKETDVRFVWPKLMDLYAPMNQAVIAVLKGEQTPQEAADTVAAAAPAAGETTSEAASEEVAADDSAAEDGAE